MSAEGGDRITQRHHGADEIPATDPLPATPRVETAPGESLHPATLWQRVPTAPAWVIGLALAVLTWEAQVTRPTPGLDPSWQAGLAMAFRESLDWGTEILFTYGPLGFLDNSVVYYTGWPNIVGVLLAFASRLAVCTALFWALRRSLPFWTAAALAFGACVLSIAMPRSETILVALAIGCISVIDGKVPSRLERWIAPSAGLVVGLLFLIKLNVGASALIPALIAAWYSGRWRSLLAFGGCLVATIAGLWVLTGNDPAAFVTWVERSLDIVSGYSSASNVEDWSYAYQYPMAAVAAAIFAACIWSARRDEPKGRTAAVAVVLGIVLFGFFKHGIRHFYGGFLVACVLLVLAVPPSPERRRAAFRAWAALAAMAVVAVWTGAPYRYLNAVTNVRSAAVQLVDLLPSRRHDTMSSARAELQRAYRLDAETLRLLQGHTVHIDPWEASVAWAYELDWRPPPVFQAYSAYTAELDGVNADMLASPDGVERVLRLNPRMKRVALPDSRATGSIDGRNPDWESPRASLALICHFAEIRSTERWQVLARVPNRCGAPVAAGRVEPHFGETVPVPAAEPGHLLFARVEEIYASPLHRAQAALLKAGEYHIGVRGREEPFRLVPETADGPLVLRPPDTLGFDRSFGFGRVITELAVLRERWLAPDDLAVEFFTVSVAPVGAGGVTDRP